MLEPEGFRLLTPFRYRDPSLSMYSEELRCFTVDSQVLLVSMDDPVEPSLYIQDTLLRPNFIKNKNVVLKA